MTPLVRGPRRRQFGGFLLGLVVGLLVGLALSLAVALYVTKVPVPFINKVPQRSPEQDAAQAEKNRNWDPNGPLSGRSAQRPPPAASAVTMPAPPPPAPVPTTAAPAAPPVVRPTESTATPRPDAGAASVAKAAPAGDPFTYFVQAGAYALAEDAEQQRAKLAMLGFSAKVTEREQSGRTMYRVRVGPFERKDDADATKAKLDGAGVDAALVRVQR